MIPEKYGDERDMRVAQKDDRAFKNLIKEEQRQTNKRRGKKKRKAKESENTDNFTVDTKDNRFAAMYDDSAYAIDPTDPRFKSTDNMQRILNEKQARRKDSQKTRESQCKSLL